MNQKWNNSKTDKAMVSKITNQNSNRRCKKSNRHLDIKLSLQTQALLTKTIFVKRIMQTINLKSILISWTQVNKVTKTIGSLRVALFNQIQEDLLHQEEEHNRIVLGPDLRPQQEY